MHWISRGLGVFALWVAQSAALAAPQDVRLITYYDYPPFTLENPTTSLTIELAQYLTRHSQGRFRFVVENIPKGRLDEEITLPDWKGMVAWINPKFVRDTEKTRFYWTTPIMKETDLVASHKDAPIDYHGPESLRGKTLGTVLNQRYADVERMIADGELRREDAPSQGNVIQMLIYRRSDVVFVSKSTLSWFRPRLEGFKENLYFASTPRNTFTRHVMLSRALPTDVVDYVTRTVGALGRQEEWKSVMRRYHIQDQIP